MNET
jgi:hypothetical protein